MTDEITVRHEFADRQPGVPSLTEHEAHLIATDMRAAGLSKETVDAHLAALGHAPLDPSPAAEAARELSALKNNPEWVARFAAGDATAEAEFSRLTLAMSQGTKTETTPRADEYRFKSHVLSQNASDAQVDQFNKEHSDWAANLGLSREAAAAIVEQTLDGAQRLAGMTADEQEAFGYQQTALLNRVLSSQGDPEARIEAAQTILKLKGGRDIDIARVARQGGAELALNLVLEAEGIARRG